MGRREKIFPQEIFDTLFEEAVVDLQKSGFDEEEVFSIIENQFGTKYAHRFCKKETQEGGTDNETIYDSPGSSL